MAHSIRYRLAQVCTLLALSIAVGACAASPALAAGAHVFDADLSLTGNCATEPIDPVADPGCPGGTHPATAFKAPFAVVVDPSGNIYIVDNGNEGKEARIDVFNPEGVFLLELDPGAGARNAAVDSEGNLYVFRCTLCGASGELVRFTPTIHNPGAGELAYGTTPIVVKNGLANPFVGLAVDKANDHLFVDAGLRILEFGSAAEVAPGEKNGLINGEIGEGTLQENTGLGLAVDSGADSGQGRLYVADRASGQGGPILIRVFNLTSPHEQLQVIPGSVIPTGSFVSEPSLAVEEETGYLFAYFDNGSSTAAYELEEDEGGDWTSVAAISHSFKYQFGSEIAVDNGEGSPNKNVLFIPSRGESKGVGHALAFGPSEECEPEVVFLSSGNVTQGEAELRGAVNPCGGVTSYAFEYLSQRQYEEEGNSFKGAQVAASGQLPAVGSPVAVSAGVGGLSTETAYRFRLVAINDVGQDVEEGNFATFSTPQAFGPCANDPFRAGLAAALPDCRAYELVTPAETGAREPRAFGFASNPTFGGPQASPTGDRVSFITEGGTIGGLEGTGSFAGDPYLASRGVSGWSTASSGPNGREASSLGPGSTSPDQGFSFWTAKPAADGGGPAVIGGKLTNYVRYPDGHSVLVGRGSLNSDPGAQGKLISYGGTHIIFVSGGILGAGAVKLEPKAPPSDTRAIYDRTPDEVTHVVSLLPEDKTPKAGEDASYVGSSLDGRGVAFTVGKTLYLRHDNAQTFAIGSNLVFAGIAEGGSRIFYLQSGNLKAFDSESGKTISFSTSGDVTPVNVAPDGSSAYFISQSRLPSASKPAKNPKGAAPVANGENLYLSREGTISFVGTVTERDVNGEFTIEQVDGLGLWTDAVGPSAESSGRFAKDPSRTTADGSALLFESRADLTGYDSGSAAEIYRYDAAGGLDCLSCSPSGAPAAGGASLQSILAAPGDPTPTTQFSVISNLQAGGSRAFFQSTEALVADDTDGLQDVYEWEAQGFGSCTRVRGCVYLISSGRSAQPDYLYSVSADGNDVFFSSADILLGADRETTYSIYDARVGGGFPEPGPPGACDGEGCRPTLGGGPPLAAPVTAPAGKQGNVKPRCPKGKRRIKRHGKARCVKKNHRRHHHHRAAANQKGGRK